jgi:hypothetical protein
MVYPHNNDLGDKKPANPNAALQEAMTAELLKIKNHYAAYTPSWVPTPNKSGYKMKILDELIKEAYLYPPEPEPQPKLVEASKYNYTYFDPSPAPVPMKMQAAEMRFEIKGLFDKTHGAQCHVIVPPEGLTEGELREFLFKNFQHITEKIISDVKKAKGIK